MNSITPKRRREETNQQQLAVLSESGRDVQKRYRYSGFSDENPDAWLMLDNDVKCIIFSTYHKTVGMNLADFFKLREVDTTSKRLIEHVASRVFKLPEEVPSPFPLLETDPHAELYKNSKSHDFLNQFFYYQACNITFTAFLEEDEVVDENTIKSYLARLTRNPYPYSKSAVGSLKLLEEYYTSLKERSIVYSPTELTCDLRYDGPLNFDEQECSVEQQQVHYQKLEPVLTENLQKLTLKLAPRAFRDITSQSNSKLEYLLFNKELKQLSHLRLDHYVETAEVDWIEAISLTNEDVLCLNRLTPHSTHLTFNECCLKESFVAQFLESPLLKQLESLQFDNSLFETRDCLGQFLESANMPHLKCLQLPYLDQIVDTQLNIALQKLSLNASLISLETLIISDEKLPLKTVNKLLRALAANLHLQNLKEIIGLRIMDQKFVSDEIKILIQKAFPNGSVFESIAELFE